MDIFQVFFSVGFSYLGVSLQEYIFKVFNISSDG